MSVNIIDLDELIPNSDSIKFTGVEDGKVYELKLFIPSAISFISLDDKIKKGTDVEYGYKILEIFLNHKYPHIDRKWIDANMSQPTQNTIAGLLTAKISQGHRVLLEFTEPVKPEKKLKKAN